MPTTLDLRRGVADLSNLANTDVERLFRQITSIAQARTILGDTLPALIVQYGEASALLGAEWYDDYRAEKEVRRRFAATPIAASDRGAQALIGWASATAVGDTTFKTLIMGGIQRRIADHARFTVAGSAVADPSSKGWARVGEGDCEFCEMLIGRGAVYSEATVDFPAHDNCQCSAEPDF